VCKNVRALKKGVIVHGKNAEMGAIAAAGGSKGCGDACIAATSVPRKLASEIGYVQLQSCARSSSPSGVDSSLVGNDDESQVPLKS